LSFLKESNKDIKTNPANGFIN